MDRRSVDIITVVTISVVASAVVFVVPPDAGWGRIVTLPLVLVLPGYALTAATFAKRPLGIPERIVLSLGLSLVLVIVGGLLLNWTPFGLSAVSWTVLLSSLTLGSCLVALARRRGHSLAAPDWSEIGRGGWTPRQSLLLGLAAVIAIGAIALSNVGAQRQTSAGFTQLWIRPTDGTATDSTIRLGVSNMESTAMQYRLVVSVDAKVVKVWPAIDLAPHENWAGILLLPPAKSPAGTAASSRMVEADLYRAHAPETIYRHVVLWLGT